MSFSAGLDGEELSLAQSETAWFNGIHASRPVDVTDDLTAVDSSGWWFVVITFEGQVRCVRFDTVRPGSPPSGPWAGLVTTEWETSLARDEYVNAVEATREHIRAGTVYQANICRILSTAFPSFVGEYSPLGLHRLISAGNPSPYSGFVDVSGLRVVTASPETYLEVNAGTVTSRPIKGTGRTETDLTDKDRAENVMIVDLVRNDLGRVCRPGTVSVPDLLTLEEHPGLVHLVSTVTGHAYDGARMSDIIAETFPPGSVTGAPKSTALRIISDLETAPRGPYCGAIGVVDADRRVAHLAVGIRSFWMAADRLHFGTGAGITWESDAVKEWQETVLKASRLIALTRRQCQ